jgi:GNAT superfamily N-acetyltransferase
MNTCSFQTALEAWNAGFQGYYVDLTLPLERFVQRLSYESISLDHSLIAFHQGRPVGFLLNAFRIERDKKIAWNGGTGVAPDMRGKGVGKALVTAAIDVYRSESVDLALLEVIQSNDSAIALYKNHGYRVFDELTNLQTENYTRFMETSSSHTVSEIHPATIATLSFYYQRSAWQTQWQSLVSNPGEAIIVSDAKGSTVAYALFRKRFDQQGKLLNIALCQCEVAPERDDQDTIIALVLDKIFPPGEYRRTSYNFRKSNELVVNKLLGAGFTTFIEQFHMMRELQK